MPHETILVVDDAPVNLKLTDILLRKEGYRVHVTTDAEQALQLLATLHPDLILVDIQLPGMNGLELTRRIKKDARTRDIVVVALTACAMKGDDAKAFQAGCDGYITKPIETLTLAKQVREFLEKRHTTPPPFEIIGPLQTLPGGIVLSGPEAEALRRRYLEEGIFQSRQLLESLDQTFHIDPAMRLVRGWVEGAQLFGYPAIGILAGAVDGLLRAPNPDRLALCEAVSNVLLAFAEPPEAVIGPLPPEIAAVLQGKNIALVGCAEEEAFRLRNGLERAGAQVLSFESDKAPDKDALAGCSAVVVHVRPENIGTHWLHPLTVAELRLPLMLVGLRSDILELEASVVPRAGELLIDGWQPEEALIRLSHLLSRAAPAKPAAAEAVTAPPGGTTARPTNSNAEILIADDDVTVRMVVRSTIQAAGIKCRMACTGHEALQMIRDCRPPAAVLDVNMPGIDGYEVLATVRQEGLAVRIVLLTARQQEADITRGFTLGADDFIVKPFNPVELLARLKRFL